jgi:multidrug resistance efflux pump
VLFFTSVIFMTKSTTTSISEAANASNASSSGERGDWKARVKSLQLPTSPAQQRRPWLGILCVLSLLTSVAAATAAWYFYQRAGTLARALEQAEADTSKLAISSTEQDTSSATATPSPTEPAAGSSAPAGQIALQATGYIVPARQILVSPQVPGRLIALNIEEGMRVRKGQVIGLLEPTEYQANYRRALGALEQAREQLRELENGSRPEEIEQVKAELAEARERLVELESNYQRIRQLATDRAATEEELVSAEQQYRAQQRRVERLQYALTLMEKGPRQERIAAARAAVAQAEAELARAEWQLQNCTIVAPISGTVLRKNAEEGNMVNPVAFNGSYSICEMADLSDLEVELTIQQRDIRRVFVGQKCKIRAIAYMDRYYDGVVDRLMPIADRAKEAVPVRVKISIPPEEEGIYLKPEMTAEVTFFAEKTSVTGK